jgi:hypothetical protein
MPYGMSKEEAYYSLRITVIGSGSPYFTVRSARHRYVPSIPAKRPTRGDRRCKPNQGSGYNQIRIDLHTQPGTLGH